MPFEQDVVVTEIKADFDPFGGEYTSISLGYRLPIPMPPTTQHLPPQPQPIMYKHAIHVIIPRESWTGQYTMWERLHVVVDDNGEVRITKIR
jgi:hypothetical protein